MVRFGSQISFIFITSSVIMMNVCVRLQLKINVNQIHVRIMGSARPRTPNPTRVCVRRASADATVSRVRAYLSALKYMRASMYSAFILIYIYKIKIVGC